MAIVEIDERIERIIKESALLKNALIKAEMYGYDYSAMTKKQQYELGSFVNLVSSSTTLLTNPIQGLQPKYTEEDFEHYLSIMHMEGYPEEYLQDKKVIVYLANLLYHVELDDKDKDVLGKSIRSNTDLLKALNTTKKSFDIDYIDLAIKAVKFMYME